MNKFPFTSKDQLREISRDKLVRLAGYYGVAVKKGWHINRIINTLWDKFHPPVVFCDGALRAVEAEVCINSDGDEIVTFDGITYNLSKMSVRIKRILEAQMRAKEE